MIIKKEKTQRWHVAAPERTEAWWRQHDVSTGQQLSVDLVNVDQVNGQLGPRPDGVHMSAMQSHWQTCPACQVGLKKKEKEHGSKS